MEEVRASYTTNLSQLIREETFEDKKHLVAPLIMIKEGVVNDVLYTADELNTFAQAWNGVPVTVMHPADETGKPISANSPEVIEQCTVGRIFNARFEDGKLKAEAWIDPEKDGPDL